MAFLTKRLQAAITAFRSPRAVKSAVWGEGGWWGNGYAGTTSRNHDITFTEQGAATAYQIIVEVQRGVMFIADSIAMLPAGIYDSKTDKLLLKMDAREFDLYTPGATFLSAVRAYERQWKHNFIERIIFSDWLYGETFVVRLSNDFGGVTGLRWLNPLYTEPMELRGHIDYYQYTGDDGYYRINPSGMAFRIHHANPRDDLRGISPVLSALPSMNIERNAERGIMAYFRNGMVLGGVMMPEGQDTHLLEPEINKIQQDLRQHHTGVDQSHRWLVPPVRMTFETFNQPDLEKNYAVVKDASKKIMMALGVPPELAGNPDSVSYDNADKIMRNWLLVNGKAYANKLAGYINTSLLPYFEPRQPVYFKFDFTQIDRQDAALVQADFTSGIITINEALIQRGYKENPLLAGIRLIGGKPISDEVMQQLANDPAAFGAVTPTPLLLQTPGIGYQPNQLTIPGQVSAPALPEPEPQKGAASLWVGLSLANNPDLIDLQKRLKALYPDPGIKWNDPAEFHITLLYVPAVEDDQVNELVPSLDLTPENLELKVGSLACFDNVGEHALHFRIARNSDLLDMQSTLYDLCDGLGLQPSGYSRPAQYTPHITMGYLPEKAGRITFHGKVRVTPVDVICSVERGGENETVWTANAPEVAAAASEDEPESAKTWTQTFDLTVSPEPFTIDHDGHTHDIPIVKRDYTPQSAFDELKAWRRYIVKGNKRAFVFTMLRGDPADFIAERQAAGDSPDVIFDALKARFDGSALRDLTKQFKSIYDLSWTDAEGAIKALSSIESEFTSRFAPVIDSMRDGSLSSRQRAGNILRQLIRVFGARAYRQGLEDGGVTDAPDADEQAQIDRIISEQSGYVSSLTDRVLSDGGANDTLAAGQADSWWRKSILVFYYAGFESAKGNALMVFTGPDGLESCVTCQKLKGKKRRLKWWSKNKLRPQVDTENFSCGGWRCQHVLEEVTGSSDGE